mgnify:CR=1 FL=1
MKVDHFYELEVYKVAFDLQQAIFDESKNWPKLEDYSLTDQIRRSSRSIGANISEAWAKRRYSAHFVSKLTDADGELQETHHWLSTAAECGYLSNVAVADLIAKAESVGRQLGSMIKKYQSFSLSLLHRQTASPPNRFT